MTIRSDFENFLLPERVLSLKVIFDNVRNYLICGAILSMTFWLQSGRATAPPIIFNGPPKDGWQFLIWASLAAFFSLFLLNAYQSYLIGRKAFKFLDAPRSDEGDFTSADPKRLPWYLHLAIYVFAAIATVALIFMIFALALFAIYFSWFAAIGGRA
ncbi:MAG: hypothetical protein CK604_01190 [Curvibacter sp. PD_MW3]|nr:MAG: hypothetical protein CK604_01190 [Curvibacter sp. PD_MW3]